MVGRTDSVAIQNYVDFLMLKSDKRLHSFVDQTTWHRSHVSWIRLGSTVYLGLVVCVEYGIHVS